MSKVSTVIFLFSLFITTSICSSSMPPHVDVSSHPSIVLPKTLPKLISSSTEGVSLYMEGQQSPIISQIPISKTETLSTVVETVTSSVHARKGAIMEPNNKVINTTVLDVSNNKSLIEVSKNVPENITVTDLANNTKINSTVNTVVEPVPKKPTVTIARDEENSTKKEHITPSSIPIKTSETLQTPEKIAEVIPPVVEYVKSPDISLNNDNEKSNIFTYFRSVPSNQPGFIIPIIITIFAVPFLALIGYQAVRRGKEAWRNRHYRRMDYLIDGMYND